MRDKLTYANVMVTLLMFIVLGGGAYAATKLPKNSVGANQIRENAVTGVKVKDGSLSGLDIDAATIGTVPSAIHAEIAGSTIQADEAVSARHATSSETAEEATRLDGFSLESVRDNCSPKSGKPGNARDLCYVSPPNDEDLEWPAAVNNCSEFGGRLPGPADAGADLGLETGVRYWTDDFWTDEGVEMALAYRPGKYPGEVVFEPLEVGTALSARCVTTPSNIFSLIPKPPTAADAPR